MLLCLEHPQDYLKITDFVSNGCFYSLKIEQNSKQSALFGVPYTNSHRQFFYSPFFAGFSHKICVISTPRACILESERTMDPVESFSGVIRFAQRMLAEKNEFCARGASKFRKFSNFFVKFLRGFRVISTPDAHFFGYE